MSDERDPVLEFSNMADNFMRILSRLKSAEARVRHLERVLKQAVVTHGGCLRISHAAAAKLTGSEVLDMGSDASDPGYGWVTLVEAEE